MAIRESGEMYLETILILSKDLPAVRSIDVAREMNFSKPSVSNAMKHLKNEGYLTIDENGSILLTKQGKDLAEKIYERHTLLTKMFVNLGVEESVASEDACRIEHVISDTTFAAIKAHLSK